MCESIFFLILHIGGSIYIYFPFSKKKLCIEQFVEEVLIVVETFNLAIYNETGTWELGLSTILLKKFEAWLGAFILSD